MAQDIRVFATSSCVPGHCWPLTWGCVTWRCAEHVSPPSPLQPPPHMATYTSHLQEHSLLWFALDPCRVTAYVYMDMMETDDTTRLCTCMCIQTQSERFMFIYTSLSRDLEVSSSKQLPLTGNSNKKRVLEGRSFPPEGFSPPLGKVASFPCSHNPACWCWRRQSFLRPLQAPLTPAFHFLNKHRCVLFLGLDHNPKCHPTLHSATRERERKWNS